MAKRHYSDAEDRAIARLVEAYHWRWREYLHLEPVLQFRPVRSIASRVISLGFRIPDGPAPAIEREGWPPLGTIIFEDEPRAVRDHGSLLRLPLPSSLRSEQGSSLRWAASYGGA